MSTNFEITEEMMASLPEAVLEDLETSYATCDPLQFARHLYTLDIDDKIKSVLLAAKVNQRPKERDGAMEQIIERSMNAFWQRIEQAQV